MGVSASQGVLAGEHGVQVNIFHGAGGDLGPSAVGRRIWGDVPARNLGFTGREELLSAIRVALVSSERATVQALRGIGGVGKTQLAAEYVHRYAPEYDLVWWVAAEHPELIAGQFAELGAALGCGLQGADAASVRRAVLGELHGRERWLLVFDNAESPEQVTRWLPTGRGHVLITSRAGGWDEVAAPVEVDVLERGESVAVLRRRVPGLGETEAGLVARELGDLLLAVAQAAAYMVQSGMSAAEYVRLVRTRAAEILEHGRPSSYPLTLTAVTLLALDRLEADSPAAAQVMRVCALLAPEPVPARWFTTAAPRLPGPLGVAAAEPLAWGQVLTRVSAQALARVDRQGLLMHRLTQAIIRSILAPNEAAVRDEADKLLTAAGLAADSPAEKWLVVKHRAPDQDYGFVQQLFPDDPWMGRLYLMPPGIGDARNRRRLMALRPHGDQA